MPRVFIDHLLYFFEIRTLSQSLVLAMLAFNMPPGSVFIPPALVRRL